jgi:hypothetical protein
MRAKIIITVTAAFLAGFAFSCANQSAPGGGPEDKTPPELHESYPQNGEVNVSRRASVSVMFSEWINLASVSSGAVSVYPSLPDGVEVKASKNRLRIIPKQPLAENTTYHVVINTTIRDLRGNSPPYPINIVFSTGAELDSGKIDGSVISLGRLVPMPRAALYRDAGGWSDSGYFAAPDYVAHCDSSCKFQFTHLRDGKYRILAFTPQTRSGRLRPGDVCFAPPEQVVEAARGGITVRLYPSDSDTLGPRSDSIWAEDGRTLRGRWNKVFDPKEYRRPEWRVSAITRDKAPPAAKKVKEYITLAGGRGFYLVLEDSLEAGAYKVNYSYGKAGGNAGDTANGKAFGGAKGAVSDSLRFETPAEYDTTRLKLARHLPPGPASLSPGLRLVWSRPAQVSLGTVTAVDTAGSDTVAFAVAGGYSDTTRLTPSRRLMPGTAYRLAIPPEAVKDIRGNIAFVDTTVKKSGAGAGAGANKGDTSAVDDTGKGGGAIDTVNTAKENAETGSGKPLLVEILLSTVSADSLCYRLQGGAECLEPDAKRKWTFRPVKGDETFTVFEKAGAFSFDTIPASKGTLLWFFDDNGDDLATPGRLFPWRAPERFFAAPDTVEAKARWEVEGVNVKGCAE